MTTQDYFDDVFEDGNHEEDEDSEDELSCDHCGPWCESWGGDNICMIAIEEQAKQAEEYESKYVTERMCPTCQQGLKCYQIPVDELWLWPGDFYNPMIALDIYAVYGAPKGEVHHQGNIYHVWIGQGEYRREELIQLLGKGVRI